MNKLDFKERVAIVTGAGSGIGREYATLLASRGARVVVNDFSKENADETVNEISKKGGRAVADYSDISMEPQGPVETAISAFDQIDILVNNAGIVRRGSFGEQDSEEWWKVFDIHVKGTVEVTRAAWPYLVKSESGCVINTASNSMLSDPGITSYSAAKAAIWGFSNTLADEGKRVGVRVHAIMPVAITPMAEKELSDWDPEVAETFKTQFTPARVANLVVWLAHQDSAAAEDATTFRVGGGTAARATFAALPAVRPTEDSPEGWTEVADKLVQDSEDLKHFWSGGNMVSYEIFTANPDLAEKLSSGIPKS